MLPFKNILLANLKPTLKKIIIENKIEQKTFLILFKKGNILLKVGEKEFYIDKRKLNINSFLLYQLEKIEDGEVFIDLENEKIIFKINGKIGKL